MMQAFRLLSRAPTLVAVLLGLGLWAAIPSAASASPHYYVNLVKSPEGEKVQTISWGNLSLVAEGATIPTECEHAVGGYIENPSGGGPGKGVTEAFDSYNCHNTECQADGGHFGVSSENENAPGLRNQISWPGELTEAKVGTIRLKMSNVAEYFHCQFGYEHPTEKAVTEGPFAGTEERDTAEYNKGTKVTCTTKPPGLRQLKEISGISPSKPTETAH